MALKITHDCINCGLCETECPNEAISVGDDIREIDPKKCTECVGHFDSSQCQGVCPVECIIKDPKNEETHEKLMAKFKSFQG